MRGARCWGIGITVVVGCVFGSAGASPSTVGWELIVGVWVCGTLRSILRIALKDNSVGGVDRIRSIGLARNEKDPHPQPFPLQAGGRERFL